MDLLISTIASTQQQAV